MQGAASIPVNNNPNKVTIAAMRSKAMVTLGKLGGVFTEIMLDSGSSVSLVQSRVLDNARNVVPVKAVKPLRLVTASGDQLPIVRHVRAPVKLGELQLLHDFVVVDSLVAPVILGVDFLHGNSLVLDFTQSPVVVRRDKSALKQDLHSNPVLEQILPIYEAERNMHARACAITALDDPGEGI